jgi:maleamate amidohydrolase
MVDFINAFTDPSTPLGGDFAWEITATRRLQEAFRRAGLPIVYTTIAYAEDLRDAGSL